MDQKGVRAAYTIAASFLEGLGVLKQVDTYKADD